MSYSETRDAYAVGLKLYTSRARDIVNLACGFPDFDMYTLSQADDREVTFHQHGCRKSPEEIRDFVFKELRRMKGSLDYYAVKLQLSASDKKCMEDAGVILAFLSGASPEVIDEKYGEGSHSRVIGKQADPIMQELIRSLRKRADDIMAEPTVDTENFRERNERRGRELEDIRARLGELLN